MFLVRVVGDGHVTVDAMDDSVQRSRDYRGIRESHAIDYIYMTPVDECRSREEGMGKSYTG